MVKLNYGNVTLIVAVIIFSYPVKNFYTLTWLIGLFILINGVIQLLFRRTARALAGSGSGLIVVIGILILYLDQATTLQLVQRAT